MPMTEKDVRWVQEPRLGIWEQLYLPALFDGLKTTLGHMVRPKLTEQYPEQEPKMPGNYRGVHRLNRDAEGRVKCVACYMCATACPAHCIDIVAAPAPPEWKDREKYPETFVLDELRCIYCGMCEEACPVEAIELTGFYDLTGLTRDQMIFDKVKLLSVFDVTKDAEPMRFSDPAALEAAPNAPHSPPEHAPASASAAGG